MPKQTFFNLPEEKRNKIINISLLEFAQHSYRAASVSRIVEKAGIAKGSMYQYFKNKKGLYLYLIDFVTNRKLSYLDQHLDSSIEDFYILYKQMIFLAVKYDLGNLGKSLFTYNALHNRSDKEMREIAMSMKEKKRNFLKKYVITARERGQIRKDVDVDLITCIINQIGMNLDAYMSIKFNFTYINLIEKGILKLPISDKKLASIIDELIEIFKDGFEPKKKIKA
jgi:AcrR family transcriptional regulator